MEPLVGSILLFPRIVRKVISKLSKIYDNHPFLVKRYLSEFKRGVFSEYSPLRRLSLVYSHIERQTMFKRPVNYQWKLPIPFGFSESQGGGLRLAFPVRKYARTYLLKFAKLIKDNIPRKGHMKVSHYYLKNEDELRTSINGFEYPLPYGWSLEHEKLLRQYIPLSKILLTPLIRFYSLNRKCEQYLSPYGTLVRALNMREIFNINSGLFTHIGLIPQWVFNKTQYKLLDYTEFCKFGAGLPEKASYPMDNFFSSVHCREVEITLNFSVVPTPKPLPVVKPPKPVVSPERKQELTAARYKRKVELTIFKQKYSAYKWVTRTYATKILKHKEENTENIPLEFLRWRSKNDF